MRTRRSVDYLWILEAYENRSCHLTSRSAWHFGVWTWFSFDFSLWSQITPWLFIDIRESTFDIGTSATGDSCVSLNLKELNCPHKSKWRGVIRFGISYSCFYLSYWESMCYGSQVGRGGKRVQVVIEQKVR